jgi:acyl-CoA reductase-like NAD-dependent aldehyde dehydrogenase
MNEIGINQLIGNNYHDAHRQRAQPGAHPDPGFAAMNEVIEAAPELTRRDVADAIVRARRERSDYLAAVLRSLAQRLRPSRKTAVPGSAVPC